MPKVGRVYLKPYQDADGNTKERHSGKMMVHGQMFNLNLFPINNTDPEEPTFDVFIDPVK